VGASLTQNIGSDTIGPRNSWVRHLRTQPESSYGSRRGGSCPGRHDDHRYLNALVNRCVSVNPIHHHVTVSVTYNEHDANNRRSNNG